MEPNLSRRRFLSLSAGVTAMGLMPLPVFATSPLLRHWTGSALGGPASIAIHYPDRAEADRLIGRCVAEIGRLEGIFSLYRPDSALSRLNRDGHLAAPPSDLVVLLSESIRFSRLTGGAFDVTVQPLWNGFSYAHIAKELNVKNAAIHYHFPSKEELACAVIQRYRDRFQLWINNSRIKELNALEKLDWFFSIYTNTRADNGKVCLAGSLETEFNSLPASLQQQTEALTRELLTWLQATLQEGKETGAFHFSGDSGNKAALILASLQGALTDGARPGNR